MNRMHQIQQAIVMALIFLMIIGSVHYYLWLRLVGDSGLPSPWRELAALALVLLCLSIPFVFFLSRAIPSDIFRVISFVPYTWLGVMMLLLFAFLSMDAVKLMIFAVRKISTSEFLAVEASGRLALSRILACGTLLIVMGMTVIGIARAARTPVVKRVEISLSRFPSPMNGLKIVQISDLHIGATVGSRRLQELIRRVNALKPDIIAVTGDLVDGEIARLRQELLPLRHLSATHGAFFVTGNHEYYCGVKRWIAEIEKLGIRVLRNESIPIGQGDDMFYLAGVDDYSSAGMVPKHGQNIRKAITDVPRDKAVVLLAHQPRAVQEASDLGIDLVLSGHTHGGQIWPFTYLVSLQQPYNKGLHRHSEKTQIYINQGTFIWGPPMRIGTECEITELILKSGV